MSVYVDYPVGACSDVWCEYAESHRHGFDCDKSCECAGVGAVTQPTDEYSLPTCDWGHCNRVTVAERLEVDITSTDNDEVWLSVCSWHAGWDDAESSEQESSDEPA